ncbi:DUF937 domain-containing protein [Nocardia panacis]|uniref:DUF937 domain-containing protein n=1 Tax=Nocardia panacis TaxID=2340916 RepID=A0A3A4L7A7_9NOCA|nr:DUF937 domain-containing protein [Nocardia panacis]RJO78772.1 DUF937 domain-containing protein [Nocardia panacis]
MTSFDDLLALVPIAQIAAKLGVDESTAASAVQAALPTLLGGLQAGADHPEGASTLVDTLAGHGELVEGDGAVDIDRVDVHAGSRIVDDVFGADQSNVISTLGATDGAGGNDLMAQVLPILAPIVLAYLAKQLGGAQGGSTGAIGEILGGLLGGGGAKSTSIGSAVGEALAKNAGPAIGKVLGGLFGKK